MTKQTKNADLIDNVIVLRSVYGKVGQKIMIQPCKDPRTGRYPDFVKQVDSHGDMILTDEDRSDPNRKYFIKVTDLITIEDGTTFDLKDPYQNAKWEAIKNCPLIAEDREEKDENGNYKIDGTMDWRSRNPRYGTAELYVDHPGLEAQKKVTRKQLIHKALTFIFEDDRGAEGRVLHAKLLGKYMNNMPDADVTDYLMEIAEKNPEKIINIYTGNDTSLRLLFVDAKDKKVIYLKNKLYFYADDIVLGATDDAVISWMQDPKNKKTLELIRKDVYPENYKKDSGE